MASGLRERHCRVNSTRIKQSRLDSDLGLSHFSCEGPDTLVRVSLLARQQTLASELTQVVRPPLEDVPVKSEHVIQSRPYSGLGFQVKVRTPFKVVPSSLESGRSQCVCERESGRGGGGERECVCV